MLRNRRAALFGGGAGAPDHLQLHDQLFRRPALRRGRERRQVERSRLRRREHRRLGRQRRRRREQRHGQRREHARGQRPADPGADLHDREQRQRLRRERHHRAHRGLHEQHGDRREPDFLEPRRDERADPWWPSARSTARRIRSCRSRTSWREARAIPASGSSANGPGTYLTFNLPFPVHLDPNTTYGFDLIIGNGSGNSFELLGTSGDPYAGGTAYTRSGSTITPLSGDRVFQVNMTASAAPYAPFAHPGALHTQADFDRMKAKIDAGAAPWKTSYDQLAGQPLRATGWGPTAVEYINRGGRSRTTTPAPSGTRRRSTSSPCAGNSPATRPMRIAPW